MDTDHHPRGFRLCGRYCLADAPTPRHADEDRHHGNHNRKYRTENQCQEDETPADEYENRRYSDAEWGTNRRCRKFHMFRIKDGN